MSRYKQPAKKQRLAKCGRQTKWTPFWIVARITGKLGQEHPSAYTVVKRMWRRGRTKA